jgi:glutathione peroxidase
MLGVKTAVTIHDFSARLGTGEERPLTDYRGKVLLIVNVASKCGFTPQYIGLLSLYEQFQPRGFQILAFPCDQFGHQEPGSNAEIAAFCDALYG